MGLLSLLGYYQNKDLTKNLAWSVATIENAKIISGDQNVHRGGRYYIILWINYSYIVEGKLYHGSAVVGHEDRIYGIPSNLHPGSTVKIGYNINSPEENILRSKLKREEDKTKLLK